MRHNIFSLARLRLLCVISGIVLFALPILPMSPLLPGLAGAAEQANAGNIPKSEGWKAVIGEYGSVPPLVVAVDKNRQQLFLYQPTRPAVEYQCTTGQMQGDKQHQNDLKTPEGVYFITGKISSGLEFEKYGYEAYPLNYPNPVDKLRKKTGYGIWIHGRGTEILPLQTQGCVSLANSDIAVLGNNLKRGMPVALASDINSSGISQKDQKIIAQLEQKVQGWAKAWGSRSHSMFDYYNPEAYTNSQTESFTAFRAQKERIFAAMPWIETKVRDVQILPGPGYWVTWFYQDYKAPNLSTSGIRRLYWQEDAKGELRIVGMEWEPGLDMPKTLLAANTVKGVNTVESLRAVTPAPLPVTLDNPQLDSNEEVESISPAKGEPLLAARAENKPAAPAVAPVKEQPKAQAEAKTTDKPVTPAEDKPSKPAEAVKKPESKPEVQTVAKAEAKDVKKPEAPAGKEAKETKEAKEDPERLIRQGKDTVEKWRVAWEKGQLANYMSFYAPQATQGNRKGADAINDHKRNLWKSKKPSSVVFKNVRVTVLAGKPGEAPSLKVEMLQEYKEKSGYSDKGQKTLILQRIQGKWLIVDEDWQAAD